jgi:lysozyme
MSNRVMQAALKDMGLYHGEVDGIRGPQMEAAVREWLGDGAVGVDDNTRLLLAELHRDEGRVLHAYQDHLGFWTIGTGRLIDRRKGGGISDLEADHLLLSDVARIRLELDDRIPWWRDLDPVRQRAVQNMGFQLGTGDFDGATFRLIRDGKYAEACRRLRGWLWAKQTPARAERVIRMIETGRA